MMLLKRFSVEQYHDDITGNEAWSADPAADESMQRSKS
jgi:hypothetical protein